MSALSNQPDNPNFLAQTNFRFVLQRAPTVVYFAQQASVPGLTIPTIVQPSPFSPIPRPGQQIDWQQFQLSFRVDEDFRNYLEIFNWIMGISFPEGFDQFTSYVGPSTKTPTKEFSDATLSVLDSHKQPNIEVRFENMFPVSLSNLDLNVTSTEIDPVECSVVFKYQRFTIEKL